MDRNQSQNTLNGTDKSNERIIVSLWYGIWSSFGLFFVSMVLIATIIQKRSKWAPFFIFLVNLNIANILMFIVYSIYVVPCVVTGRQVYGEIFGRYCSACQSITFSTIVLNSFLISVNRSLTVCQPKLHDKIFTLKMSKIITAATWFISSIGFGIDNALGCQPIFFENRFIFSQICTQITVLITTRAFISYFCIYGVAVFYIIAVWKLWETKKRFLTLNNQQVSINMTKYHMNMFYQATCIWLSLLGNSIGMLFTLCNSYKT